MKKNTFVFIVSLSLAVFYLSGTTTITSTAASHNSAVTIQGNNYEWHYAIINGVYCKRLYDNKHHIWIGNWIPM